MCSLMEAENQKNSLSEKNISEKPPIVPRVVIQLSYLWCLFFLPLLYIEVSTDPVGRAIVGMAIGLVILWTVVLAIVQYIYKDKTKDWIHKKAYPAKTTFVVFCIVLALIEEAITTTMTNLATPVFGVSPDEAYITASTNYLEVVLLHSVIIFVPMFITWAFILSKYRIHHLWVFVLFGFTGTLSETLAFGPQNLINVGFWTLIYGLLVYLPAYTFQYSEDAKTLNKLYYPSLVILPIFVSLPFVYILLYIHELLGIT
jgi:hypothetical protein